MSSDNRTPRLHSFRIACAIASATLCATAIAQVAFSLKPAIEVLDNPVIADSPRVSSPCDLDIGPCRHRYRYDHPQRRSRVDDQERRPLQERVCDMLEGARHSLRCSSCHQPLRRLTQNLRFDVWRRGGRRRPRDRFIIRLDLSGSRHRPVHAFPALLVRPRAVPRLPTRLRKETPCPLIVRLDKIMAERAHKV